MESLILHVISILYSDCLSGTFETKETIRNIYEHFLSDPIVTDVLTFHDGENNPNEVRISVMKPYNMCTRN